MSEQGQNGHAIETMQLEERRYPPPSGFAAQANARADIYDRDWEDFWREEALARVSWSQPFDKLYEWKPPYAKWFLGGKLNACFNAVDRHVEAGRGDKVAYHWEGEPEGDYRKLTFADLQRERKQHLTSAIEDVDTLQAEDGAARHQTRVSGRVPR